MTKKKQLGLLIECAKLLFKSDFYSGQPFSYYFRLIMKCHKLGYLYVGFENNKIVLVTAGLRIPEIRKELIDNLQEEESGTIAYIPFLVSVSKDRMMPLRMLKKFLPKDITEVYFQERNNNFQPKKFRRMKWAAKNLV